MNARERLSAENVRPGLRICERHPVGQDRVITGVVNGRFNRFIECRGVASGRVSTISWKRLGSYDIVGMAGS